MRLYVRIIISPDGERLRWHLNRAERKYLEGRGLGNVWKGRPDDEFQPITL